MTAPRSVQHSTLVCFLALAVVSACATKHEVSWTTYRVSVDSEETSRVHSGLS